MSTWFLGACLVLALVGGAAVVAFETPTRSAAGLLTAFVGVAGAAGACGAPVVPGFILWVGGGGIGLLLLAAVLLLNLGEEERGRRRIRLRAGFAIPVLGVVWGAIAAPLVDALPEPLPAGTVHPVMSSAVTAAVVDDLALPFTVGLIALAAALVVGIAIVRRRT